MKKTNILLFSSFLFVFLLASPCWSGELEEIFAKGQQAYDAGDYRKAIQYFEQIVNKNSNYAPVYNALGLAHSHLDEKLADVIWFFKVAVQIDPKYLEAYNNMCRVCYEGGDYEQGEKTCLKALELNPSSPAAQLSLAWIYLLGKNQPKEAISYFDKVREKVKSPTIYFGLGMAYYKSGDNAQVLDMITILRAMGEGEMAGQLERMIRPSGEMVLPESGEAAVVSEQKSGTLVPSAPTVVNPAPATEPTQTTPISGQMKIRLKGRMVGATTSTATVPVPIQHPGSL